MHRSSIEIVQDCRSCLGVDSLIVEFAVRQAVYIKNYYNYDRRSESMASEAGQAYLECEDKMLRILELSTFCRGSIDQICKIVPPAR